MELLRNVFRNKETKKKVFLTLLILLLIRLGSQIPTYGVNMDYFKSMLSLNAGLGFFNSLTGNSFSSLSIFTLSITPYITSSIIVQLLTIAVPKLEEISKDGPTGKEKIEKITYIVGGVLGFIQAAGMAIGFGKSGLLQSYTWYNCLIVTLIWGLGAVAVLFFAKLIDKKGIGSGVSLILLTNILSSLPNDVMSIASIISANETIAMKIIGTIIAIVITIAVFLFALVLNDSEKKIHVHYSGKVSGNHMSRANESTMPIKVCIAGVMPVIFASSIMSVPVLISSFLTLKEGGVAEFIFNMLNSGNWFDFHEPLYTLGYLIYVLLVIFFGYFYVSISFNTMEIANNLKKSGGTINGIRPGQPTVEYLNKQVKYLTFIGTIGLLIIATIPMIISGVLHLSSLSFGGTSIIIIASVIIETKKKLETETYTTSKKLSRF